MNEPNRRIAPVFQDRCKRNSGRARFFAVVACAALLLACMATPTAWAQSLAGQSLAGQSSRGTQPLLPEYASARSLRDDSTLRGVAFRDPQVGIVVGDRGVILQTVNGGESWKARESGVECALEDVFWMSEKRVIVAGGYYDAITQMSRGVILVSNDAGQTWRRGADQELARVSRLMLDPERSVVIAAGDWAPGTMSMHHSSRDGGLTWNVDDRLADEPFAPRRLTVDELTGWASRTLASVAIRAACRSGESLFWAVGDHGVIFKSADAGRTWTHQRGAGRQTSVVVIGAGPATVAWPIVGSESLEMGNRVAVLIIDPSANLAATPSSTRPIDLARHAAMALGASSADATDAAEAAVWLGIHRPSVVVLDRSIDVVTREALSQAAIQAGAQRVVISAAESEGGETRMHRSAMLPRSGVLAGDLWQDALNWVAPTQTCGESITLRRSYDAVGISTRGESVTAGMTLAVGQRLTHQPETASRRQLQIIQARLSEPQRIDKVIASSSSRIALATGIESILAQSANEDRARLAWSIYRRSVVDENRPLQSVMLDQLADAERFGVIANWAQLYRDAVKHSREWNHVQRDSRSVVAVGVAGDTNATGSGVGPASFVDSSFGNNGGVMQAAAMGSVPAETVAISPFQNDTSRVALASAASPLVVPNMTPEVATPIAASSLPQLAAPPRSNGAAREAAIDLAWEFHPLVLVTRDAIRRQKAAQGEVAAIESSGNLQRLSQSALARDWSQLVGPAPLLCRTTAAPPRLDGRLDDPCWASEPVRVAASPGAPATELRLAYDQQYLYVAAQFVFDAATPPLVRASHPSSIRDNNLTALDRLSLSIDIDRDLMTAYRLESTPDRLTRDSIDQHRGWQPTWYVASAMSAPDPVATVGSSEPSRQIVFELAFLLRDFVEPAPATGDSWLIKLEWLAAGIASTSEVLPTPQGWLRCQFE